MATLTERLGDALNSMRSNVDGIVDCGVVSMDGLILSAVVSKGLKEGRLATMCAATEGLSKKNIEGFKKGKFEYSIIKGSEGFIIVMDAGTSALLAVSTTPEANLGILLNGLRESANEIADIM